MLVGADMALLHGSQCGPVLRPLGDTDAYRTFKIQHAVQDTDSDRNFDGMPSPHLCRRLPHCPGQAFRTWRDVAGVSVVHGSGYWCRKAGCHRKGAPISPRMPALPYKLNQDRRHHIPQQQRKVTNWPAYEAGLRQRGSLTVWFTDDAIATWAAAPRTTRGGQPFYSPLGSCRR